LQVTQTKKKKKEADSREARKGKGGEALTLPESWNRDNHKEEYGSGDSRKARENASKSTTSYERNHRRTPQGVKDRKTKKEKGKKER